MLQNEGLAKAPYQNNTPLEVRPEPAIHRLQIFYQLSYPGPQLKWLHGTTCYAMLCWVVTVSMRSLYDCQLNFLLKTLLRRWKIAHELKQQNYSSCPANPVEQITVKQLASEYISFEKLT